MKSLELLYGGDSDFCKEKFRTYLVEKVLPMGDNDTSLKKFIKSLLQRMSEEHSQEYMASNLTDIPRQLN